MKEKIFHRIGKFEFMLHRSHLAVLIFFEIILGTAVSFTSLLIFIKLAREVLEKDVLRLDTDISMYVISLRSPLLTAIMKFITFLASEPILALGSMIIFLYLVTRNHRRDAIIYCIMVGIGIILNMFFKELIHLPRPHISPLVIEKSYSFPSGHSMNSFVYYGAIVYFIYHVTRKKKFSFVLCTLSFVLVGMIGFSRIYLGVHYPSDVLAGFIAGFWWLITVILIDKTLTLFELYEKEERG